jgi:hypothetical protein
MSMYAAPQAYGQVPYGAPTGYVQRAPAPYQHNYPPQQFPPQPMYHVDPNTFRKDYSARLAELTVNSRPIIQGLSMMAQEYSRWADIVGQCLQDHIRRVSQMLCNSIPSTRLGRWHHSIMYLVRLVFSCLGVDGVERKHLRALNYWPSRRQRQWGSVVSRAFPFFLYLAAARCHYADSSLLPFLGDSIGSSLDETSSVLRP